MNIYAESGRLILREILPTDLEGFYDLDADPEVHRYLGNKPVQSKEAVADVIRFVREQYLRNGIGRWAIVERKTGEFIGWTGLKWITEVVNNHQNYYDLGYRLRRKFWGKGIATESGLLSLNYAFNHMHLNMVYAAANCDNQASHRVLTKLGFEQNGMFYFEEIRCNWYELSKTRYEEHTKLLHFG